MKKIAFIIVIYSIVLSGCQGKNTTINYEGKSKNWDITYKIDGNEQYHDSYYTFRYTGTEDNPESSIRYFIDGPKEGESGKFSLDCTKEYTGKMSMSGGLPSVSDRGIKVKIEWNGKTEMTQLNRSPK